MSYLFQDTERAARREARGPSHTSGKGQREQLTNERMDQSRMGHRVTQAASHLSVDEVKERMKTEARPWVRHHWWIIYNALVAPRDAEEIALHTGVSVTTVHRVIATYNRLGPEALETPGN